MKILNKINNCLSNETGGPNVEQIIGIGMSIGILCALTFVAGKIYAWIGTASKIREHYSI